MYTKAIFGSALVALSSMPSVLAGSCSVKNECGFDVYLWSIANTFDVKMNTLSSGSGDYSEEYRTNPNGGGISIKISPQASQAEITQLEYTLGGDLIYYDMSNINGSPFQEGGMKLAPADSSCPTVNCPAGVVCSSAYINPDDVATKGCTSSTDLVLTLCPGGGGSSSSSSSSESASPSSAASSSSSSSATPTPTTLATSTTSAAATESAQVKYRPVAARDGPTSRVRRHAHGHGHIHERQ